MCQDKLFMQSYRQNPARHIIKEDEQFSLFKLRNNKNMSEMYMSFIMEAQKCSYHMEKGSSAADLLPKYMTILPPPLWSQHPDKTYRAFDSCRWFTQAIKNTLWSAQSERMKTQRGSISQKQVLDRNGADGVFRKQRDLIKPSTKCHFGVKYVCSTHTIVQWWIWKLIMRTSNGGSAGGWMQPGGSWDGMNTKNISIHVWIIEAV